MSSSIISAEIRLNRKEDDYDNNRDQDQDGNNNDPTNEEDAVVHDLEKMVVQEKTLSSSAVSGAGGTHDDDHDDDDDDYDDVNQYLKSVAKQGDSSWDSNGYDDDDHDDDDERNISHGKKSKKGNSGDSEEKRSQFRQSLVDSQMMSYKEKSSYDMTEDVYSFIIVAPIFSWSFLFASYVIIVKYIVYLCLLHGIELDQFDNAAKPATAVKFFLIPVAIAMQDDLMTVYSGIANCKYDKDVLYISQHATYCKFILSYVLRFFDGGLSLLVNFLVMLQTDDVLGVFLNFAALHFLQDIDDVFYKLVEKGFFGDSMEHMSTVCKQVSWPRRRGTNKSSILLTELDSIFFGITLFILLTCYVYVTILVKQGDLNFSNTDNDSPSPSWSPTMMNETKTAAPSMNF
jgi:hypothetical protein